MRFLLTFFLLAFLATFYNESFAQQKITIKGVVKDKLLQTGKAGVTISAGKPPRPIATTKEDGSFTIEVNAGTELTFTHTGYAPMRQKVTSAIANLEIVIAEKDNPMQAVVVQGFKTKTRETATGSSVIVSGKTLQDVPVSNVMQLLQGKVAG